MVMLMPAALMLLYSAECTVGQIAHISKFWSSETGKVRTPGLLPESLLQNGSPTVIVGPKLLSPSLSFKPMSPFSQQVHPAWAPTSGTSTLECSTSLSANVSLSFAASWLPSLSSSALRPVHPRGTEAFGTNPGHSAELHGCRVGCSTTAASDRLLKPHPPPRDLSW